MKKFTTICIAVAAALAIAGCGKGSPGASAENSAGLDTETKVAIDKSRSITKDSEAKISATIPASVSISDAAAEIWGAESLAPLSSSLHKAANQPGKFSLLAGCTTDAELRQRAAGLLLTAHAARTGWPIDPEASQALKQFFVRTAATAEFASKIEAQVSGTLSVAADPDSARAAAKAALLALPEATIRTAAEDAVTVTRRALASGVEPDLATGRGIGMTAGQSKYSADQTGWSIERQGVKWFGGGFADGREYKVALESSVSKSLSKKQTIETHEDAKLGTKDTANAKVE